MQASRLLLIGLILHLPQIALSAYACTSERECAQGDRYGAPATGTESNMEAACDADVNCVAYDWDAVLNYGFKCSGLSNVADVDFKWCTKP